MKKLAQAEKFSSNYKSKLEELDWTIEANTGKFVLIFARCQQTNWHSRLIQRLQEIRPLKIQTLTLKRDEQFLYRTIKAEIGTKLPDALMVLGLESVHDLEQMLAVANQVREEFRKNFPFPLVFWVDKIVYQKLIEFAPDLESWGIIPNPVSYPPFSPSFSNPPASCPLPPASFYG